MSDLEPNDQAQPPRAFDDIPVEELIRLTRALTRRITDQDRQRLTLELRESGHARALLVDAPMMLRQFFAGEIDLDTDLARRFGNAPLMTHCRLTPAHRQPLQRRVTAIFSSNDDAATLMVDAQPGYPDRLVFTFVLFGAIGLRFALAPIQETDRHRWPELMRRENGITFLWTQERWEQPYLIFVVREGFGRLYGNSPHGFEAAVRLTPDMCAALVDWLEGIWFPERDLAAPEPQQAAPQEEQLPPARRPARRRSQILRTLIPDAPEEQWDDEQEIAQPQQPAGTDAQDLPPDDLDW